MSIIVYNILKYLGDKRMDTSNYEGVSPAPPTLDPPCVDLSTNETNNTEDIKQYKNSIDKYISLILILIIP